MHQKKTYATGLIIGRFQPFHRGHLFLFQEALKHAENIIVGIGSINVDDDTNPFSQTQIEQMIQHVVDSEGWNNRIQQIFGIPDVYDDRKWLQSIVKKAQLFDVVISHNVWVMRIFREADISVLAIPFYKRDKYEGVKIRDLLNAGDEWEERVPESIIPIVRNK